MPALCSLLWFLVVSGNVFEVSSKKTTTLKKRQQVLSFAEGNFLLHSSPVTNDDVHEKKSPASWGTRSLFHKSTENNGRRNGYLREGHDPTKSERIGFFSAEKQQVILRNGELKNKEILIDNGDEVWPKSEEELETREETEEEQLGRKVNFEGSHNDKFETGGLNHDQGNLFDSNFVQDVHHEDKGISKTVPQNGRTDGGLVGVNTNTAQQFSGVAGAQQYMLPNMPNINAEHVSENISFKNTSGSKYGHGLEAHLDMQHKTLRNATAAPEIYHNNRVEKLYANQNATMDPEIGRGNRVGKLRANQNATLPYAHPLAEELIGYPSKPIPRIEYQSSRLDSTGHGNRSEQINIVEQEDASKDHDHISTGSTQRPSENTQEFHKQRGQTQSNQDANLQNLGTKGLKQLKESMGQPVINQTMRIVDFIKMATGIPIYHDNKMIHDMKQTDQYGTRSNSSLISDVHAVRQKPKENVQDLSESKEGRQDANGRLDEQASRKPLIPNHYLVSTQDVVLGRQAQGEANRPLLSADFSETNKEMQDKTERQGEQVGHDQLEPNLRQEPLDQEQKIEHHKLPSATDGETNNYKPPIPSHVLMQHNTTDLNKTTIVASIPNMVAKTGLQEEETPPQPAILTDEPMNSSEDIEGNIANSRQWTLSSRQRRNRGRSRYRDRYGNQNRNSMYRNKWRPSDSWNRPGVGTGQGGAMVPGGGGGSVGNHAPQTGSAFAEDALSAHNNYRRVHNAGPMTLDRDLSKKAQRYAQKIASLHSLTHSSDQERGDDVGENLAYACKMNGVPLTGSETTKMWYDEVCKYDFDRGGFSMSTGHFTQVVWTDSLDLGMGMVETSEDGMNCIYAVGRYRQAGNYGGQFQDKVLRGNFDRSYCNNVKG